LKRLLSKDLFFGSGFAIDSVANWEGSMETARRKPPERRSKARFPIRQGLRYKVFENDKVVAQGTGETIDMGSAGISFTFTASEPLCSGNYVELSISWPALLQSSTRMQLVVFGRVLRTNNCVAACTIDKHEFRTQARGDGTPAINRDSVRLRWADLLRKSSNRSGEALA